MGSVPVTNYFDFYPRATHDSIRGSRFLQGHSPAPVPIPQYSQNSCILLYSLNVEYPWRASPADIGSQLGVVLGGCGSFDHGA